MPILNVREMGSIGVVSDIAPWDLPPSALTDGVNFRMSAGKIQSAGGLRLSAFPQDDELGHVAQSTDLDKNSLWIVLGEKTIRWWDGTGSGSIANNLTFPDLRDPHKWSSCQIGAQLFFNHPDWYPIVWEDRDAQVEQAQMLPWSPGVTWEAADKSCKVLRAHKNFLWALGMVEDGEVYSDKVRWSHPAEPNGYPYTWEPPNSTDRSSLAGYLSIGRGGAVVGGESLRDSFVIYSDEAINVMDFTGDALLWRRRSVSSSAGLVGKEAVVEVNGTHFLISNDDILMFDGNQVSSLLHNKLKKRLAQSINNNARANSWVVHNAVFNEIWFAVPEGTATHPTTAYVYNYRDATWALRDLEREFRHAHFGSQPTALDARTWDMPDFQTTNFDQGRASWHLAGNQPFDGQINGVESTNMHNVDPQIPDGVPMTQIARTDLPVGGHEFNTTVTRVYPLIEGSSEVEMRFGSQQYAGGPVRWAHGWQTFMPGVDRKLDIRTTGELHAYEVRSKNNGFFNLTGFDVEFSMAGSR
jgi:hypothetical protein